MAMETRIRMMEITITISSSVKPACALRRFIRLPIRILRAIEPGAVRLGEDVEHVLPAPGARLRIVLRGAHAPIGVPRHRIDGDAPQEADLLPLHVHAV